MRPPNAIEKAGVVLLAIVACLIGATCWWASSAWDEMNADYAAGQADAARLSEEAAKEAAKHPRPDRHQWWSDMMKKPPKDAGAADAR